MIKMTTFARITLGAAALAAFPLSAGAQAPAPAPDAPAAGTATLRYKFAPGQVHRYKLTTNMVGTMLTGQSGAGFPLNTATQIIMKQTVKDVRASDGAATIETEIESMRLAMNGKEQPMPDAQQAAMKKPITQVMLPTGKVLSMKMPDTPGMSMPGMDFSKSFSSLSVAFPDGPLKAGEDWKNTISAPGMEGTTLNYDSTLTSLTGDGDAARANIDQKIGGTLGMTLSQGMPMGMTMAGTVNGTGTMAFNTAQGVVENLSNDSSIDMTMTFKAKPGQAPPPGMPNGMKMQMRQKTTMELLPDAAKAPAK